MSDGFTLVEMLLAVTIAAILMVTVGGLLGQSLKTHDFVRNKNELYQEARFAMQRMTSAVAGTRRLMIPLAENPATAWPESVREFPARAAFPNETAVLAVTLDPTIDRDEDGFADANNDKDFLDSNGNSARDAGEPERIDEDWPKDQSYDGKPGIQAIDDDNDGSVDEESQDDDDEDGLTDEDLVDATDDDGDGSIDEDPDGGMSQLGDNDDDGDGTKDEDWLDPVVFYQSSANALCTSGSCLIERLPNLNPVDGADYSERSIAENVTAFRVERIPEGGKRVVMVDISLQLTNAAGESVSFRTQVRVGGAQ